MATKKNPEDQQRWNEIGEIVTDHKTELQAAEDHRALRSFAEKHGFDNRNDFGKFKHSLKTIGVDYGVLREKAVEEYQARLVQRAEELVTEAQGAPFIRLWCAAVEDQASGTGSYAILDSDGAALWYGKFFDEDKRAIRKPGDQALAEQDVADKCVYVAGKARDLAGEEVVNVWIHTNYPELDEDQLRAAGARHNVAVEIIVDEDDAAVDMAMTAGFKRLSDNKDEALTSLLEREEDDDE